MDRSGGGLDSLTRPERHALRDLLIRATAAAGRLADPEETAPLVRSAPVASLPAAAALHRVGGTVLQGLDGVAEVPDGARRALTTMRDEAALRHLMTIGALSEISLAMDAADVSWVAMKGPVVAALLYPGVGDRTYVDLDLLIAPRDFGRAMCILEDFGYRHAVHDWALAERRLAGELSMSSPTVTVDLHWHLHYSHEDRRPFAIVPEAMLARRRHVKVSGVTTPTFDPVDTVLTLAFHAARSDGHRLVWLKDLERALAVEQPDLDELVRRCEEFKCGPPVGLMLGRARSLLDADIPETIVRALTPATLRLTDELVCAAASPVQLNEGPTITRAFTRSVRSSAVASIAQVPERAVRWCRRRFFPVPYDEADSPEAKQEYIDAVAGMSMR